MARAFEVKATNVTVDPGTKGLSPDGASGTGRQWACGSVIELSDPAEIAGLVAAGAIEPLADKSTKAEPEAVKSVEASTAKQTAQATSKK